LSQRFDDLNLLILYIDGMEFSDHVMIGAVDVEEKGGKHVLAIREGTTENATVAKELLEDLVARGVNPEHKRLFVIDGSKALRTAINTVFGAQHPVQRCRAHKLRNVMDHLPQEEKGQVGHARGSGQLARRTGGVVHHQPAGCASVLASLPGQYQHHRKPAFGRAHAHAPRVPLAG